MSAIALIIFSSVSYSSDYLIVVSGNEESLIDCEHDQFGDAFCPGEGTEIGKFTSSQLSRREFNFQV